MPRRRRKSRISKRARRYVRRGRSKRRALLRRRRRRLPLAGYPKKKVVRLRYVTQVVINPPVGSIAYHQFNLNGMFDPDRTGIGHQPRGFDQQMLGYQHYTVIGSKISATYTPVTAGTSSPGYMGIYISSSSNVPHYTDPADLMETRAGAGKIVMSGASPDKQPLTVRRRWSSRKFFGTTGVVGKDLYRGSPTLNPAELAVANLWAGSISGTTDPPSMNFLVQMEFIAVLTEPNSIAPS